MFEKLVIVCEEVGTSVNVSDVGGGEEQEGEEGDLFEHQGYAKISAIREIRIGGQGVTVNARKDLYMNVMRVWGQVLFLKRGVIGG